MQVRIRKKIVWLALAAVLLQLLGVQALATEIPEEPLPEVQAEVPTPEGEPEDVEPAPAAGEDDAPEEDEEIYYVLDEGELSALVMQYLEEHKMNENNSAVSFYYTGTGESWSFNGDRFINGASLYKVSLMMGLARKVANGELSQEDKINGYDISYIEMRSLSYSDNAISEMMIGYFSPFRSFKEMQAEIAGVPIEELPNSFFNSNDYSTNFMIGVFKELYNNPEQYPNVTECLLDANPGRYFRLALDGKYTVAQKYGGGDGYLHTAAIIYTPTPCLVCVMTYRVPSAEEAIAGLGELLADYAAAMDQRTRDHYAELERQAEEARRAEEEARLAAEAAEQERIRAEEEARRAEEEARLAAEAAERARLEALQVEAEQQERSSTLMIGIIVAIAILAVLLTVIYTVRTLTRPRTKMR